MAGGFTAHNIWLDDSSLTRPEDPLQMEDAELLKFSKRLQGVLFTDGFAGKRIVDLGKAATPAISHARGLIRSASRSGRVISRIIG